jgi:HAD superfamily hydrolase (TIGR01459 family)
MKSLNKITSLEKVIEKYEALLIDIWGVIYDGQDPYEGAIDSLNKILKMDKKIIFLSNTPRASSITHAKLLEWGVDMQKANVYTSGDAVREQLEFWNDDIFKNLGKKLYHIGAERNQDILSGINVNSVDSVDEADFILLTAYIDEGEDLSQFDEILTKAKTRNIPVICANPDVDICHGDKTRYCAGKFALRYKNMGGMVYYYGKPDHKIFDKVIEKFNLDKSKLLMIGDTIETDITGASLSGIDSALVLTGNGRQIENGLNNSDDFMETLAYKPSWIVPGLNFSLISKYLLKKEPSGLSL